MLSQDRMLMLFIVIGFIIYEQFWFTLEAGGVRAMASNIARLNLYDQLTIRDLTMGSFLDYLVPIWLAG